MNFENISTDDGTILVKTARKAVTQYLTNHKKISDPIFDEKFSFNAGVFVTINDKSGLRGCIGYPLAVKKLSDALIDAAISASTNDPRFSPVKINDLDELVFEVTVLSDTEELSTHSDDDILDSIKIGRDGLIVERDMEGFSTPETHNKWSLRASATGELIFNNVKVPKENLLPNKSGLSAALGCLDSARYGISWGAIGVAMDCYDTALRYSKERIQFDKPIAGFQLQQKKLAEMITEITKAQLLAWRLGMLKNADQATSAQISMAKRNNVEMAIKIARESRQILGAMGITGDYSVMRHMMNLESVITYEGTHDIHLLITGLDITGLNAFK